MLSPEVAMVNLQYHWIRILLFQPFLQPGTTVRLSVASILPTEAGKNTLGDLVSLCELADKSVLDAASRIVSIFDIVRTESGLRRIDNMAIQISYAAGKVFLLELGRNPGSPVDTHGPRWGVLQCIRILRDIGVAWQAAVTSADRLEELLKGAAGNNTGNLPFSMFLRKLG